MIKSIQKILLITIIGITIAGIVNAALSDYWKTVDDIVPRTTNTSSLGSAVKRIKDIFMVGNFTIGTVATIDSSGNLTTTLSAQLGDGLTEVHGINTAPVANQMLTATYSNATANVDKYFIDGTATIATNMTNSNINTKGYALNADISGAITINDGNIYTNDIIGIWSDVSSGITISANNGDYIEKVQALYGQASYAGTPDAFTDLRLYGVRGVAIDNLGTTGITEHYGGRFHAEGTADTNYGGHFYAADATTNWGIWVDAGDVALDADDMKIYFGEAQDSYIEFDGDSMNFTSSTSTAEFSFTDYIFKTGGDLTVEDRALVDGLTIGAVEIWVEDGETIQNTINAITDASSSKPYIVRVPPGVYAENITMKDFVSLKGAGMYATKIATTGYVIYAANQVTISDMTVDATGTGLAISSSGVDDTWYVHNCYLKGTFDLIKTTHDGNTIYVSDVIGDVIYDGIVNYNSTSKMYVYNTKLDISSADTLMLGVFRTDGTSKFGEMYIYNSAITGDVNPSDAGSRTMILGGGLTRIYNTNIEVNTNATGTFRGIRASKATSDIEVYSSKISMGATAGTPYDLIQSAGTLKVFGVTYSTTTGTISGYGDDDGVFYVNEGVSLASTEELRFYDAAGGYVGFEAPTVKTDQIWVLPVADGTNGQQLTTDGNGTLSWAAAGSGGGGTGVFVEISSVVQQATTDAGYDEDFVFGSPSLDDDADATHDSRFFFDEGQGAFRAGNVQSTEWDNANLGLRSIAFGSNTQATGAYSFAMGNSATAIATNAVSIGTSTIASGTHSVAMGDFTIASGRASVALGRGSTASGDYSFAMGGDYNNPVVVGGDYSMAVGYNLSAGSEAATNTFAFGQGFTNNTDDSFMIGFSSNPAFTVQDTAITVGDGAPLYVNSAGNDKNIQINHNDTDANITVSSGELNLSATVFDLDSNSNSQNLYIRGADAGNEWANLFVDAADDFNIFVNGGKTILDSNSDSEALRLVAADAANDYADMYIDADGDLHIEPTGNIEIPDSTILGFGGLDNGDAQLSYDGDDFFINMINAVAGAGTPDAVIALNDDYGTSYFKILDSGNNLVAWIDSDGNLDIAGALSVGTPIDISSYTNLTAGRSLSMSADSVIADAELYTDMKSFVLEDPATADDALVQLKFATNITITRISCSTDTGSVEVQFDERAEATPNTGGTDIMTSTLTCDTNSEATAAFDNAGIAADAIMNLDVDSLPEGAPNVARFHIDFTKDD
jgi:hypothetical protein